MKQEEPSYPLQILPLPRYKKELDIDKLLVKYKDLMVVRLVRCPIDYKMTTENGDEVLSDSVFENSMANLSLNLAGGKFDTNKEAHLPFLATSDYGKSQWKGNRIDKQKVLSKGCFSFNFPCFGLCINVIDIHKTTFPFYKFFNTQKEWDDYEKNVQGATKYWKGTSDAKLVSAFKDKNTHVSVMGRLVFHHAPTNGNYWHVTLDTYRPSDTDYVDHDCVKKRIKECLKH